VPVSKLQLWNPAVHMMLCCLVHKSWDETLHPDKCDLPLLQAHEQHNNNVPYQAISSLCMGEGWGMLMQLMASLSCCRQAMRSLWFHP
jgi:hypothetical protein